MVLKRSLKRTSAWQPKTRNWTPQMSYYLEFNPCIKNSQETIHLIFW
jgi:hypothetical protein